MVTRCDYVPVAGCGDQVWSRDIDILLPVAGCGDQVWCAGKVQFEVQFLMSGGVIGLQIDMQIEISVIIKETKWSKTDNDERQRHN